MSGFVRPFGSYFKAGALDPAMKSVLTLSEHVKEKGLKLSYGKVSFDAFNKVYCSSEFFAYKIVALPSACFAGVVKMTCHIATAILFAIPKSCYNLDVRPLKGIVFTLFRDIEETVGWIVTIFHDAWGQYLVEESLFQKTCYMIALRENVNNPLKTPEPVKESLQNSVAAGVEMLGYSKTMSTTLKDFRCMSEADRQKAIEKHQLDLTNLAIPDFFHQLDLADPEIIDLVNLVDLKVRPQLIKLTLMPNEEFNQLNLRQLLDVISKNAGKDSLSVTTLVREKADRMSISTSPATSLPKVFLELTLEQFRNLTPDQIYRYQAKIPLPLFPLLSLAQIKALDFSRISPEKVNALFENKEIKAAMELISQFSRTQVQALRDIISLPFLSYFSDSQLAELDFTDITTIRLELIFAWKPNGSEKRKFNQLKPQQVQCILVSLANHQLKLISAEQMQHLDLSVLDEEQIQILFEKSPVQREKQLFSILKPSQVQDILTLLGSYQLSMITPEQIVALDLSVLSGTQVQSLFQWRFDHQEEQLFNLLSSQQVQGILPKLDSYQLSLVNTKQLPDLDLTQLDDEELQCMFAFRKDLQHVQRFAALQPKQIQAILPQIEKSRYLLSLINADQLEKLDLRKVSKEVIQLLFAEVNLQNKLRFARLPSIQVQDLIKKKKLEDYQMALVGCQA